jgi:repressor LexA
MNVEELAEKLNVSEPYVYDLEQGRRRLNEDLIKKLCRIFGVSADYLLGMKEKIDESKSITKRNLVPVYGTIRAGMPIFAEQNIIDYIYWEGDRIIDDNYFCLKVTGDSMKNARIEDGDYILVRKQPVAENGQIVVALVGDNEATVKRFYLKNDMVILKPENDNYEPQIYKPDDVQILGIVVEAKINVK